MPRIPTQDGPRLGSRPVATTYANTDFRTGATELGAGLQEFGAGVTRLDDARERVRQKALVTDMTEREARWKRRETETLYGVTGEDGRQSPGFLSLQGKDAAAATEAALSGLEKYRDEEAAQITDPKARQAFVQRISGMFEDTRRKVEGHVAKEIQAAETKAVEARTEQALLSVANNPLDEAAVQKELIALEGPIRALLPQEAADAAIGEVRKKMLTSRLTTLLSENRRDWASAKALLEQGGESLTPAERAPFERAITGMERGAKAEGVAEKMMGVDSLRLPNGRFDLDRALGVIDEHVPANEPELRREVRTLLAERARVDEAERKARNDAISDEAFSYYNQHGWSGLVQSGWAVRLNEADPNLYNRLREQSEMRFRRSQDAARGDAAARREQARLNRIARDEYYALPPNMRSQTDPLKWAAENGHLIDDEGAAMLKRIRTSTTVQVEKGQESREGEFVREAQSAGFGQVSGKKDSAAFKAVVTGAYYDFIEKNQRSPSQDEARKIIDDLVKMEVREGWIWDSEEPAWKRRAREQKQGATVPAAAPASAVDLDAPPPAPAQAAAPQSPGPEWVRRSYKGKPGYFNPQTNAFRPDP